jgi:hypothetical protein
VEKTIMKNVRVCFLITSLAFLSFAAYAQPAATDGTSAPQTPGGGHPLVHLILAHAQELNLSSGQITQLTALENEAVHHHPAQAKTASATPAPTTGETGHAEHPHHELPPKIKAILNAQQQEEVLKLLAEHHHHRHPQPAGAATGSTTK